jgi:hypothetical protein
MLGCPSVAPLTAAEQVTAMQGNFGGSADPALVSQSVNDFSAYLTGTDYTGTVASLAGPNWMMIGLMAIGVFGISLFMGDGGARRYGR